MNGDDLLTFEEQNWNRLIEKFIAKYQEEWQELVETEFNKAQRDDLEDR